MSSIGIGVQPSQWIRHAIKTGVIRSSLPVAESQIQPNSLDLRLSGTGWEMPCSVLPRVKRIEDQIIELRGVPIDISEGMILNPGRVYLFECQESLALPSIITAHANAKSSTGRLDIFARTICNGGSTFDSISPGHSGKIYVEVATRSFRVIVREGDSLTQIRFAFGDPTLRGLALLSHLSNTRAIIDGETDRIADLGLFPSSRDNVVLSVGLSADRGDLIAYKAIRQTDVLDLARRDVPWQRFWEPIRRRADRPLILDPDEFYILRSKERVRIYPGICAEMSPFSADLGELRTHYAGFFDSGFGYDSASGAHVVMEVRCRDIPFLIEDGQRLFRVSFFLNAEHPDTLYGSKIGSNYQGQGLRLGKQFV